MTVDGLFGPFVAFLAGVLSFVSPCVLPLVPVYVAQLVGSAAEVEGRAQVRRWTLLHAASFVAGFSVVFIALGASLGLIGYGLRDHQRLLAEVAGALILVFGLHLAGIVRIPFLYRTYQAPLPGTSTARGGIATAGASARSIVTASSPTTTPAVIARPTVLNFARSTLIGAGFALGWTPCIGPVLGSILTLAGAGSTVARGALLLLCYSAGLGVPFLIAGAALGSVTGYLKRINRLLPAIEVASGVLLIAVGVLLIANRLTMFNHYFDLFGLGSQGL